jgi:hypothetical protein
MADKGFSARRGQRDIALLDPIYLKGLENHACVPLACCSRERGDSFSHGCGTS